MASSWIQKMGLVVEGRRGTIVLAFFAVLFAVGLLVFDDYGVGWDERNNRKFGQITYEYLATGNSDVHLEYEPDGLPVGFWHPVDGQFARTHGAIFEVLLFSLEKALSLRDSREILLLRHLCNFLVFSTGVFFFFLVCRRVFGSWKMGLLGALLLVLSPRLFAHSFHNSMDIPFLAVFILSMHTLLRLLQQRTVLNACLHGAACAVLIDTRIAGVIMPGITIGFVFLDLIFAAPKRAKLGSTILTLGAYTLVLCLLIVLLWPMLWGNPVENFLSAFEISAQDSWGWWEHYFGERVMGKDVPWHFTPVWMAITTPPIYIALFVMGLFNLIISIRPQREFYLRRRAELLGLCCWLLPQVAVAVLHTTLFNGWRHMYFIYPGFLVLALSGLSWMLRLIRTRLGRAVAPIAHVALVAAVALSLASTAHFMVRSHPHQIVYFNQIVGGLRGAKGKFQIGYWGSEYREGLEYLLRTEADKGAPLSIYRTDSPIVLAPVSFNRKILRPEDRRRFTFTTDLSAADYFLTNYCSHISQYSFREVWSKRTDGVKILTVFKTP